MEHTTTLMLLNEAAVALKAAAYPLRHEVRRLKGETGRDRELRAEYLAAVEEVVDELEEALGDVQRAVVKVKGVEVGDMADLPADECPRCNGAGRYHQPNIGWEPCPACKGSGLANGA